MGNTLQLLSNKIQYEIAKVVSDPNAAEYAKQQREQAQRDQVLKDQEAAAAAKAKKDQERNASAEELSKRNKTNTSKLIANVSFWIIIVILLLVLVMVAVYASNESIGYNTGFRIFWFFYGVPVVIYNYISNYFTKEKKEFPFTSPFPFFVPYNQDDDTKSARENVIKLYEEGAFSYIPTTKDYEVEEILPPPKAVSTPVAAAAVAAPAPSAPSAPLNIAAPAPSAPANTATPVNMPPKAVPAPEVASNAPAQAPQENNNPT